MTCKPEDTYLVRVTTQPTVPRDTVLIFTVPVPGSASKVVPGFSFAGTRTLCFKEDPASTIQRFVIGVDKCLASTCRTPAVWSTDRILSVDVSVPISGDGGELLLKATTAAPDPVVTYTANNNPQIEGGRPIIRNPFGIVIVATLVAVVLVICYVAIRMRRSREAVLR